MRRTIASVSIVAASLLGGGGCGTFTNPVDVLEVRRDATHRATFSGLPLRSGQIILTESPDATSFAFALIPEKFYSFTHAGVIAMEDGEAFVYEASGELATIPLHSRLLDNVSGAVHRRPLFEYVAPNLYAGFQEMWLMTDNGVDTLFNYNPVGYRGGVGLLDDAAGVVSLPARVRGVVLLGPVVRTPRPSWLSRQVLAAAFAGPWDVWFWMHYRTALFPTRKPVDHAEVDAALARNLRQAGRMKALAQMIALPKDDVEALVSRSRVPALVVMGSRDPDFEDPAAEAGWLAARLHGERLVVDGAGHYPHTEMPEVVVPRLLSFLQSLPAPR